MRQVFGWINARRVFRVALMAFVGTVAFVVLLTAAVLRMHRRTSAPWTEFSIGPASGESMTINSTLMRADGVTLRAALAAAYDVPPVRIIGPPWLTETRYSINASVTGEAANRFRPLLQQELQYRLRLQTHFDVRPFDVFVLTATEAPRLERAAGNNPSTWIHPNDARLQAATMERLASALQSVLGRPVVDETGIPGSYDLEFDWGEDRVASVTAAMRQRFGLRLTPAKRELEALIVDGMQRDAALLLLGEIGRITRGAPGNVRRRIASLLMIH